MFNFREMRISQKVGLVVAFCMLMFVIFGMYVYATLNTVKVNGPYYRSIVQGKDLIADILPPPAYIIESYLLVQLIMDHADQGADRGVIEPLIQKGKQLREEYTARQAFWAEDLTEGRLKQTMVVTSSKPAFEFFDARDREFIPAIQSGQRDKARLVLTSTLRPRYEEHRMFIDQVNAIATERNKLDEQSAANYIERSTIFMVLLGLAVLILAPLVSFFITRSFTRPLQQTVKVIEAVASGSVNQQVTYTGTDEIGALADACRQLLAYTRDVSAAAAALSRGDLSVEIVPRSEQDVFSITFARATAALRGVVEETRGLIRAAQDGDLSKRGNDRGYEGAYAELINGINSTLDAIIAPINEAATILDRVAEGDLTARMHGEYRGNYASIKASLNSAIDNLDHGFAQVAASADQVASASTSIAVGSQSLAQGASEQASALEEVSSSLQEMTAMTKRTADSAQQARELATSARSSASRGVESMGRLSIAVDRIKTSASETARIVKTIDEIAFQTNLLALNAAVEAARAGDAGKGFAVVAEEVRNLAMRSADAARSTGRLIDESVKNAETGVHLNQEVLNNLRDIDQRVTSVSDMTVEIASASDQQSQGIVQITAAVHQMNQVTQQNAANAEESAASADELSGQADGLRQTVGVYQLTGMARPVGRVGSGQIRMPRNGNGRAGDTRRAGNNNLATGARRDPRKLIPFDEDLDQEILQSF